MSVIVLISSGLPSAPDVAGGPARGPFVTHSGSRGPPIRDALYRRLQPFRHLHDCSGCFRLERWPGGTCTHWKSAALSRRTPRAVIPLALLDTQVPPVFGRHKPRLTHLLSLFGLGEFADPGEAHGGYDHDERIISLMAHGIGYDGTAEIVKEYCTWLETIGE